ncbi:Atrial natriuretic peptide receptor 1 [Schistosoma japonicum]|nr:Atrial natriuretic peptide receptor 1 [Schistosoma japonicum]
MLVVTMPNKFHWNNVYWILIIFVNMSFNVQKCMNQLNESQSCNQQLYQTFNESSYNNQNSTYSTQLCWLSNENFTFFQSLNSCLGLNIVWVTEPPNNWHYNEMITIRFRIVASSVFYEQAKQLNIFSRNPLLSSSADISSFCSAGSCKIFQVDSTCCIWHLSASMNRLSSISEQFASDICDFDNFNNISIPVYSGSSLNSEWNVLIPNVTLPGTYVLFIRILVGRFQAVLFKRVTVTDPVLLFTITIVDPEDNWIKLFLSRSTTCHLKMIDCNPVAEKQINVEFTELTEDMKKQLWEVKKMKHDNLVKLIGITFISPVLSLYTEFCDRGSLCYVLRRDSIPLSWSLRLGFLTDLANGLAYLHNYPIVHGRLNSSNCVVNDKWICKITDYGLDSLFWSNDFEKHKTFLDKPENLPYIPPEYRDYNETLFVAEIDIYSFGTIMWETASRREPSQDDEFMAEPIYNHPEFPTKRCFETDVKYEVTKAPPIEEYNRLMESCWSEITLRPKLNEIIEWLNKINPRNIGVDAGTVLTKEYARCLESIIEDRTQALRSEQKMADTLLNSMLPKQVVEMLRHGENVPPEAFEQCTIYFSDIVGFTNISSSSTPFEVVEFLNKLYTQFDDIIDRYDVYKVETIGDAYMVASGVPRRNGERHAIAIADMSLDLVNVSHSFVIPHKPDEPLKIRVGLHSGPVCAGVVGLKMPRYCLFGDTVNTASRMESTGEAYKIHCSETTHAILDRLGGFTFEKRGVITVKIIKFHETDQELLTDETISSYQTTDNTKVV